MSTARERRQTKGFSGDCRDTNCYTTVHDCRHKSPGKKTSTPPQFPCLYSKIRWSLKILPVCAIKGALGSNKKGLYSRDRECYGDKSTANLEKQRVTGQVAHGSHIFLSRLDLRHGSLSVDPPSHCPSICLNLACLPTKFLIIPNLTLFSLLSVLSLPRCRC